MDSYLNIKVHIISLLIKFAHDLFVKSHENIDISKWTFLYKEI